MNELRDYQVSAVKSARALVKQGRRRIILQAPTGAGKSVIVREIISLLSNKGRRAVFVAPRLEIVEQLSAHLDSVGIEHGILQGTHWRTRPWLPVQVATSGTLMRREAAPPDVLFLDEAHLHIDVAKTLVGRFPKSLVIGTTATPIRLDGRGLGEVYEAIVPVVSVRSLIDTGYLCPFRIFAPSDPDLSAVRTTAGDFNKKDLRGIMDTPCVIGNVIETWRRLANGQSTIVFATGVEASKRLAQAFRDVGVNACHVDAETPGGDRQRIVRDLGSGALTIACNVELFTYGLDVPRVSCVSLARPTQSLALHLQMIGRGLRPAPGKDILTVLDHSSNTMRHDLPDVPREWSLTGVVRRRPTEQAPGLRLPCPVCFAVSPASAVVCVLCGAFFPKKPRIVLERPGELREVTLASRAGRFDPEMRARMLAKWIRDGRERGYAGTRAGIIFRRVFGVPVEPAIEEKARAMAGGGA